MKPEQQNKAIAEFCGHRYHKPTEAELKSGSYYQYEPDYLNDLNKMHGAEEKLHGLDWAKYFEWIQANGMASGVRATAAQRAEALLRTIGKWKDETPH